MRGHLSQRFNDDRAVYEFRVSDVRVLGVRWFVDVAQNSFTLYSILRSLECSRTLWIYYPAIFAMTMQSITFWILLEHSQ